MNTKILSNENGIKKRVSKRSYPIKTINDTLTNGFFTVDQKWIVKYWNKAAETLLHVKSKDILGKNLWENFAGIIPLEFYRVYQKAFIQELALPRFGGQRWGDA